MSLLTYGVGGDSYCGKTEFCETFWRESRRQGRNVSYVKMDDCKIWRGIDGKLSDLAFDMKESYIKQRPMGRSSRKLCTFVNDIVISHIKQCETQTDAEVILFDWFLLPYLDAWKDFDKKVIITANYVARRERFFSRQDEGYLEEFIPKDMPCDLRVENSDDSYFGLNRGVDCLMLQN